MTNQLGQSIIENRLKWDLRFLDAAELVSKNSKDPSTKVGAVIVNGLRQIVGQGYNGLPRGVVDHDVRYTDRDLKYKYVVHAELNAILQAGDKARGSTLYLYPAFGYPPCCNECCKAVIQAGIHRIVGIKPEEENDRWEDSLRVARIMCEEAGIKIDLIER